MSDPPAELLGGTVVVTWPLTRPEQEESGPYTCIANSSLGTTQRTLNVDVLCELYYIYSVCVLLVVQSS